jgi:uncharacterized protein YegL
MVKKLIKKSTLVRKARKNKKKSTSCDIVMILDRSGSMALIQSDMEGGLNNFIKEQKKLPGKATFTLVKFDDRYEKEMDSVDLQSVGEIKLEPRGSTALLDAIGKTINGLDKKSNKVMFIIITDGEENASMEYTQEQVKKLIGDGKKDGWEFIFLGTTEDGIQAGISYGISAINTRTYTMNQRGVQGMCCYVSDVTTNYRK